MLNELEQYGLIERVKQGQGKPAKIYVKNFAEEESPKQTEDGKADLKTSEKSTCRLPVSKPLDCPKGAGIYTDKNYNDYSYTDLSINPPTPSAGQPEIERCDQRDEIMRRIDTPLTTSPRYPAAVQHDYG